jgi:hypothetical protein
MSLPGLPLVMGQPYGQTLTTTSQQSPGGRLVRTNTCGTNTPSTSYNMSYSGDQGADDVDPGGGATVVSEMYGSEATTATPAAAYAAAGGSVRGGRGGGLGHPTSSSLVSPGGGGWVTHTLLSPQPIPTPSQTTAAAAAAGGGGGGGVVVRRGKDKTTPQGAAFWAGSLREVEVACGDKDGMFDLHT